MNVLLFVKSFQCNKLLLWPLLKYLDTAQYRFCFIMLIFTRYENKQYELWCEFSNYKTKQNLNSRKQQNHKECVIVLVCCSIRISDIFSECQNVYFGVEFATVFIYYNWLPLLPPLLSRQKCLCSLHRESIFTDNQCEFEVSKAQSLHIFWATGSDQI